MKKLLLMVLLATVSCGKKEESAPATKSEAPAASASASASTQKAEKKAVPLAVSGAYAAKQGAVRMPDDAPPFIHPESKDGVGDGELSMTLPAADGAVTGKATGALGAQTFSGWLEGDRLTGTLAPNADATPMLWGVVEGKNDNGAVTGTIRASNSDGRVVREATFTLKKK
ncbi:MAG: hypothetical protein ACXVEE_28425 [Polyangiales bacterium]